MNKELVIQELARHIDPRHAEMLRNVEDDKFKDAVTHIVKSGVKHPEDEKIKELLK